MTNLKKEKTTKVSTINTSLLNVIKYWLFILKNRHKLKQKEEDVVALLIYQYVQLSKEVTNPKLIWKLVFDYDSRQEICEKLNMTTGSLENYLTKIRSRGVIIDNVVNPNYMPDITGKTKQFSLHFNFNIIDNESK